MANYIEEQFNEFRGLVDQCSSMDQMERITGRLHMPEFVQKVGKEICDEMFQIILDEGG